MGQALYRKYRSRNLAEIVGQEHITAALTTALKQGKISHAYLFTGPRGVGKTSIARILAYEVNSLPYDDIRLPIDIIEIDAASNRRIDEIRDLRDKVHIAPANAKYKVYIIDEVHMLTKEAFNALLKTLEEPPAHVIFVLATTEAHKLPETIISRTQRFTFKPVMQDKVVAHLRSIAEKENIDIDDDALALIAAHGEGSFRDSISLLDQASNTAQKVTLNDVRALLGIAAPEAIDTILELIATGSPKDLLAELKSLRHHGTHAASVATQLSERIRRGIVEDTPLMPLQDATTLLGELLKVRAADDSERMLEIVLLDTQLKRQGQPAEALPTSTTPAPSPEPQKPAPVPIKDVKPPKSAAAKIEPTETPSIDATPADVKITELWAKALDVIRQKHNTLYGILRTAEPRKGSGATLVLAFAYQFHLKRISDAKNKKIVMDILADISGKPFSIECIIDKQALPPPESKAPSSTQPVQEPPKQPPAAVTSVFGEAEVLEA